MILCRKPGTTEGPFDRLARSSLYTWFTPEGKLKPKYVPHIQRQHCYTTNHLHLGPLGAYPELVEELCDLLLQMRENGQSLNAGIIQPIILGFLKARAPEVLEGTFKVSMDWTRKFIKKQLD